jgi:hypothetical protein
MKEWLQGWKILWRDGQGSEIWKTPNKILFCQKSCKKYIFFESLDAALVFVKGESGSKSFLKHCERIREVLNGKIH